MGHRRLVVAVMAVTLVGSALLSPASAAPPTSPPTAPVPGTVVHTPADADGPAITRYLGASRADTASLLARDNFVADTVLLARQDDFPDSLGGGFLAGQFDAPVLLTSSSALSAEAQAAIDEIQPDRVVVLGGTAAVSDAVVDDLRGQGLQVDRLAGAGRYDTGAALATAEGTVVGTLDGKPTAILASGTNFPDVLVMSALSYAQGWPLLLTAPTRLVDQTAGVLTELGITRVLIAGGEGAVSPDVAAAVAALGIEVTRLAGPDRVSTATAIAEFAVTEAGFDPSTVNLATGRAFPDALALGPVAGLDPSPVLLTNGPKDLGGEPIEDWLDGLACVTGIRVSGGTAAVPDEQVSAVRAHVADADDCDPPPSCPDDEFEPNDRPADAAPITSGVPVEAVTCSDDVNGEGLVEDLYTLEAFPGDTVEVDLDFLHADSDLDLFLFDANGTGYASHSATDGESISETLPLGFVPPLSIFVTDQDQRGATYRLTATVTRPTCADDVFGPNDTEDTATPVTPGQTLSLSLCGPVTDILAVPAQGGDTVRVTYSDVALDEVGAVVGPSGSVLPGVGDGATDGVYEFTLPMVASGPAYVFTYYLVDEVSARVRVDVLRSDCPTNVDAEPNDAVDTALVATSGVPLSGNVCGDDRVDVHTVSVNPGDTVVADLTADEDVAVLLGGDPFAQGFTPAGGLVVTDLAQTAIQAFLTALDAGNHPYTVQFDVGPVDCSADEAFESNDIRELAQMHPGGPVAARLCGDDSRDWFRIDALPGDAITVVEDLPAGATDRLFSGAGSLPPTQIAAGPGAGQTTTTYEAFPGFDTSPFWWMAELFDDADAPYTVDVSVAPPACPQDDPFEQPEDVDTNANPYPLTSVVFSPEAIAGRTCPVTATDEQDWYELTAPAASTLSIRLEFVDAISDLDLLAQDSVGNTLAGSSGTSDGEQVEVTVPPDGIVRVRVLDFDNLGNTYRLFAQLGGNCAGDEDLEPNDAHNLVAPLVPRFSVHAGVVCAGDPADWFQIDVATTNDRILAPITTTGDLDVVVGFWDIDSADFLGSYTTLEGSPTRFVDVARPGRYFVSVEYLNGSGTYELTLTD